MAFLSNPVYGVGWSCLDTGLLGGYEEKTDYFHFVMFFKIAIFTGLRRGELLGLEWKDFNFDNCLMQVRRNSLWTKEKGIYTDTPKTKGSIRMLKIPLELVNQLLEYKEHQEIYKASLGNKWIECDRRV